MHRLSLTGPLVLAAVVTLANAVKPVLIDDTAYLTFARHIAAHPFDPYGFELFWYDTYDPAMTILCPPVLPYWLALGIAVFGEHPAVLKLTLFPFVWLLAWSLRELLRRFARGTEPVALPLLMLSPAILPTVNLMLDIPALALGLGAVAVFARAVDGAVRWPRVVLAGILAALAMQTKYTMLLIPPLIAWYGITQRRLVPAAVTVAVAIGLFVVWEWSLVTKYGQSHFVYHVTAKQSTGGLWAMLSSKSALVPGLVGHLGLLGAAVGLYASRAIGVPRRGMVLAAGAWCVGAMFVAMLPAPAAVLIPRKLSVPILVWRTAGTAVLIAMTICGLMLLVRSRRGSLRFRVSADTMFVVGWVMMELGGYFVLTPFPAARRVIGPTIAFGILAARVVSLVGRARPDRKPPRWVLPFAVTVGVLTAALDTFDAYPEKQLAEMTAAWVRSRAPEARLWYSGHWGFQYYCERAGMRPFIAGRSEAEVRPGDYLILPAFPDEQGFYRPHPGSRIISPRPGVVELVAEAVWDDPLPAQTIPNLYGGEEPIVGREHRRLHVQVFRVIPR